MQSLVIPEKFRNKPSLKIEDVAFVLDVSISKAYAMAQAKLFPSKKLGYTVRIPTFPFFCWFYEDEIIEGTHIKEEDYYEQKRDDE